jgi:hypothetical protein
MRHAVSGTNDTRGAEIIRAAFNSAILLSELLGTVATGPLPNDGMGPHNQETRAWDHFFGKAKRIEKTWQACILRDVFGNHFRPITLAPAHRTPTVVSLARAASYERHLPSGELDPLRLSVLVDPLEETGAPAELVAHLRSPGEYVRGCHVVDLCLGLT